MIASIKDGLDRSLLRGLLEERPKIMKTKLFQPSNTHPFYNSIVAAQISITKQGAPDMLMHCLPINLNKATVKTDVDTTNIDEEEGYLKASHEATQQLMKLAEEQSGAEVSMLLLLGVSGYGKTRSLYELLCWRMGFYFTGSTLGHGGHDAAWLSEVLRLTFGGKCEKKDKLEMCYVNALLLSQAVVLEYYLDICL